MREKEEYNWRGKENHQSNAEGSERNDKRMYVGEVAKKESFTYSGGRRMKSIGEKSKMVLSIAGNDVGLAVSVYQVSFK